MIASFRSKALRRLYADGDRRGVQPDMAERIAVILAALDSADRIEAMDRPSFRLHPLSGRKAGYWAVTVRANWRIVFRFDGDARDVDLVDYHEECRQCRC